MGAPTIIKTEKIILLSRALLYTAFLYIAYSTLQFEIKGLFDGHFSEEEQQSSALLLLQGSLLYAFVYLGGGWLFFYKLAVPPKPSFPKLRNKKTSIALLWGIGGGALAFLIVFSLVVYGEIFFGLEQKPEQFKNFPLREILQRDWSVFFWHLLCSALLTALLEEGYYRACLQNYLQHGLGPFLSISISAFVFALVHGDVIYFMLLPAFVFSILFWKQGLLSAIVAHAVYNAFILTATAKGY